MEKLIGAVRWFFKDASPAARRARWLMSLVLVLVLFAWLFWRIPFQEVLDAFLSADPLYFSFGILVVIPSWLLSSKKLQILLQNHKIHRSVLQLFGIDLSVRFYSYIAPTTLVGSGVRWYRISQPEGNTAETLVGLVFYRLLNSTASIVIGLGFWLMRQQQGMAFLLGGVGGVALFYLLLWISLTRISRPISYWLNTKAGRLLGRPSWKGFLKLVERFLNAVAAYADMSLSRLAWAVLLGFGASMFTIFSNVFLSKAVGLELSFADLGWVQSVVNLATQLPFAVVGGLGIREVGIVAMLGTLGIAPEVALAYSFLKFVRSLLFASAGGFLELGRVIAPKRVAGD